MAEEIVINLTRDRAIVLSHWLDAVIGTQEFDAVVNRDRAVWSPVHRIAGSLDTALEEIFANDYAVHVAVARERLLRKVGNLGLNPAED